MSIDESRRPTVYNPVARLLHWGLFLLIAAEFAVAWLMPDIHRDTRPEGLVALHIGLGTLILSLMVLRLVWRVVGGAAPVPAGHGWQRSAARGVHDLLYLGFLVLPLLGWANASARGWTVHWAGLATLPALAAQGAAWAREAGDVHQVVAYGLLGLIGLHILAALQHQILLRDGLLHRMWPSNRRNGASEN